MSWITLLGPKDFCYLVTVMLNEIYSLQLPVQRLNLLEVHMRPGPGDRYIKFFTKHNDTLRRLPSRSPFAFMRVRSEHQKRGHISLSQTQLSGTELRAESVRTLHFPILPFLWGNYSTLNGRFFSNIERC